MLCVVALNIKQTTTGLEYLAKPSTTQLIWGGGQRGGVWKSRDRLLVVEMIFFIPPTSIPGLASASLLSMVSRGADELEEAQFVLHS